MLLNFNNDFLSSSFCAGRTNSEQVFGETAMKRNYPKRALIAPRVEKTCGYCNRTFLVLLSRSLRGDGKFCDKSCHDAHQRKLVAISGSVGSATLRTRFWRRVDIALNNDCWEWTGAKCSSGYGSIRERTHGKTLAAHRLAYELVNGPVGEDVCILHKCDNRGCVNPFHLFLGTRKDNSDDMIQKGRDRHQKGEENGRAVLKESDVRAIRLDDRPYKFISDQYGVTMGMVGHIKRRRAWRHITDQE